MGNISQIVFEGGWKESRVASLKVKAWLMLFLAILFGGVAVAGSSSFWFYASVPSGVSLLISVLFFFREKPRSISLPSGRVDTDLRKLYSSSEWHDPKGNPVELWAPKND